MIDHIGLTVSDFRKSKDFYTRALAPLGYKLIAEYDGNSAGFRVDDDTFWITQGKPANTGVHVAFNSPDREQVKKFYSAAMEAGGRDNGGPGLRSHYHANYYGAFVFDPDGNNIEAVCHKPE